MLLKRTAQSRDSAMKAGYQADLHYLIGWFDNLSTTLKFFFQLTTPQHKPTFTARICFTHHLLHVVMRIGFRKIRHHRRCRSNDTNQCHDQLPQKNKEFYASRHDQGVPRAGRRGCKMKQG